MVHATPPPVSSWEENAGVCVFFFNTATMVAKFFFSKNDNVGSEGNTQFIPV